MAMSQDSCCVQSTPRPSWCSRASLQHTEGPCQYLFCIKLGQLHGQHHEAHPAAPSSPAWLHELSAITCAATHSSAQKAGQALLGCLGQQGQDWQQPTAHLRCECAFTSPVKHSGHLQQGLKASMSVTSVSRSSAMAPTMLQP